MNRVLLSLCVAGALLCLTEKSLAEEPPDHWREGHQCDNRKGQLVAKGAIYAAEMIVSIPLSPLASIVVSLFGDGLRQATTAWVCHCTEEYLSISIKSPEGEYLGNDIAKITYCKHDSFMIFTPKGNRCYNPVYNPWTIPSQPVHSRPAGWHECN
jgi:hypothetical protein